MWHWINSSDWKGFRLVKRCLFRNESKYWIKRFTLWAKFSFRHKLLSLCPAGNCNQYIFHYWACNLCCIRNGLSSLHLESNLHPLTPVVYGCDVTVITINSIDLGYKRGKIEGGTKWDSQDSAFGSLRIVGSRAITPPRSSQHAIFPTNFLHFPLQSCSWKRRNKLER